MRQTGFHLRCGRSEQVGGSHRRPGRCPALEPGMWLAAVGLVLAVVLGGCGRGQPQGMPTQPTPGYPPAGGQGPGSGQPGAGTGAGSGGGSAGDDKAGGSTGSEDPWADSYLPCQERPSGAGQGGGGGAQGGGQTGQGAGRTGSRKASGQNAGGAGARRPGTAPGGLCEDQQGTSSHEPGRGADGGGAGQQGGGR